MISFCEYASIKAEAKLLLNVSYVLSGEFEKSAGFLDDYLNTKYSNNVNLIHEYIEERSNKYNKSAEASKLLSTILPGLGQIYAGEIGAGINAFLLNTSLGYICFHSLKNSNYFDSIFYFTTLFWRYYSGNRNRAYTIVINKHKLLDDRLKIKILEIWE